MALAAAHEERVDAAVAGHLDRRRKGQAHPVEDFLFTYYSWGPSRLRRWHPGVGTAVTGGLATARGDRRFYGEADGATTLDGVAFVEARGGTARFVHELLERTAGRPASLACFGLHEWAMVYRSEQNELRHGRWPLRLGAEGTDGVVESSRIACTHFDAYRFFTVAARPRNLLLPTRETQAGMEQPGCLHAGMDLYKWACKLSPAVPSELVMDCFELARDLRVLDMEASPYDLRELGYQPVRVETAEGRVAYAARQRDLAARGQALRSRLLAVLGQLLSATEAST